MKIKNFFHIIRKSKNENEKNIFGKTRKLFLYKQKNKI